MIQDIAPHNFNITYTPQEPTPDSFLLIFHKGQLLVGQEGNEITFPTYNKVREAYKEKGLDNHLTYLFQLDGRTFFCYNYREEGSDEMIKDIAGDTIGNQTSEEMEGTYTWQNRTFFRTAAPKEYALAAITAMHLEGWYQKNKYCGACGEPLVHDTRERMLRCFHCDNRVYPRINPAVIVGVTHNDKLLLTKYKGRAYKKYALVAGFTEIGESFEQTVQREVMEEVGLKVKNIRYYKSQPWGFSDNILAGYFCEVDGESIIIRDEEELSVAEWFQREEIPVEPEDLSLTNEMIIAFKQGQL